LLLFVHGFNNRYEKAVYRFAQIAHDSKTDATPVMFTWPSRGSVFEYPYDKESTNYSRSALEAVLSAGVQQDEIKDITILAHSMGTWLTVESLRQMAIRNNGVPAKIANVILAAPDLDVDVFRQQLADMGPNRPKFTVFVSKRRSCADLVEADFRKCRQAWPDRYQHDPAYRELLENEGITVLDLSALQVGDSLNHSKFAESPEVVRLLGQRLIDGQTVTDQDLGLGAELGEPPRCRFPTRLDSGRPGDLSPDCNCRSVDALDPGCPITAAWTEPGQLYQRRCAGVVGGVAPLESRAPVAVETFRAGKRLHKTHGCGQGGIICARSLSFAAPSR
jgi:pimeloyl-ACP methyl ester carboxylesterase